MNVYRIEDMLPLDFGQTLDLLAAWSGQEVRVSTYAQAPGEPCSHTMSTIAGTLGDVLMTDNAIDPDVESVAGFPVGTTPHTGFYLSPGDHRMTQPLTPGRSVRIDFAHNFSVQVDLV
ncbi:MAG: hypothetical protein JWR63_1878 [Conexibacter sp.]|nr:hypothetical protein [Conexibacter sp.]